MRRRQSFETVLIGKNVLIREGIAKILHAANFIIPVSASSVDELPNSFQSQKLMFLIVHTGDGFNLTIAQIRTLKDRYPEARIAIVADNYRPTDLAAAFRAGVHGYFVNVNSCDAFIKSVELVTLGETVFPPAFLSFILDASRSHERETAESGGCERTDLTAAEEALLPQLSPREKAILACIVEGDSNKWVARKIKISEATVKVHVKAILRKIRVQNRTQAAIWGMNHASLVQGPGRDPMAFGREGHREDLQHDAGLGSVGPSSTHVAAASIEGLLRKSTLRADSATLRLGK
jgi:two-component system nitrate/nitrite response regulator NarL